MKFATGDRVILQPPPNKMRDGGYRRWVGSTGTIGAVSNNVVQVMLDPIPEWWNDKDAWFLDDCVQPLRLLSPLEQLIVQYVEAQKAELGI